MTDPTIIEAVASMISDWGAVQYSDDWDDPSPYDNVNANGMARKIINLIEADTLERAALIAEEHAADYIADEIRSLK